MIGTLARLLARGGLLAVLLFSAAVCLLVDVPFTYQAVIRAGLLPWLPTAMSLQPWLLLLAVGLCTLQDRRPEHRFGLAPRRLLFLAVLALAGGFLAWKAGLSRLEPGPAARIGTVACLLAAAWLLLLDLIDARPGWPVPEADADDSRSLLVGALCTAAFVALAFFGVGLARAVAAGTPPGLLESGTTLAWSLVAHGLILSMGAVAVLGLQSGARLFPRAPAAEFLVLLAAFSLAFAATLARLVFPGIAFSGAFAQVVAVLLGFCLAAALALAGLGLAPPRAGGSPLRVFLRPLHPVSPTRTSLVLALLLAIGLALLLGFKISRYDWNFLFQQLGALAVAALAFAAFYLFETLRSGQGAWGAHLLAAPLCCLVLFRLWGLPVTKPTGPRMLRPSARALDSHAGFDPSARLAAACLRPTDSGGESIYRVLLANSNIPHDVKIAAKNLNLVEPLVPTTVDRPDIFVFVVDSLRQDHVGAYNRKATFTPSIDRFAAESTVIPRAFTRYGATGLSEPSIWVGGMILHKQYIVPFHPLNTLQKLLEADGYQPLISMDSILDVVVKPSPGLLRLDAGIGTGDLRLGATLKELRGRLDQLPAGRPVFVYSQAQDLHISTINREGKDVPGGGDYPGFYAPYASRVRRLDAEFGAFIQDLKDRGRYERSLIILTADHGDSLGEDGRFGHAYTLFPEIMRVPLILHVPEGLRAGLGLDPGQAAFLTDITPTLYYLLGHRALLPDPVLGRPLFTATAAERQRFRRDHHLLASSYGAVWGILDGDGGGLYISDGVNLTDHYFDLSSDPAGRRKPVDPGLKQKYDQLIVKDLDHLNTFYAFRPGKGPP